jgi:hypothetical protein
LARKIAVFPAVTPMLQSSCLDALTESTSEVSATALGGMPFAALGSMSSYGAGHGAYVGLVAQDEPIQVGLLVDAEGCQALSKSLLGMEPSDDDLPLADVSDAMCEIINIVAGGLKRRVSATLRISMGLPIFVAGPPLPNQQQDVCARRLRLGAVEVCVLLLTQRPHAVPISKSGAAVSQRGGSDLLQTAGKAPAKGHSV